MKKLTRALAFAVIIGMLTTVALAADPETVTVEFDQLRSYVETSNTTYVNLVAQIDASEAIKRLILEQAQEQMKAAASASLSTQAQITSSSQAQARAAEEAVRDIIKLLPRTLGQVTYGVQSRFLNQYILQLNLEAAQNKLASLERQRESLKTKLSLGLVSKAAAEALDTQIASQQSAILSAQLEIDKNLLDIKSALGIPLETTLALGELPAFDPKEIDELSLEEDTEIYINNSQKLEDADDAVKKAREKMSAGTGTRVGLESAQLDREQTIVDLTLALHNSYESLQSARRSLTDLQASLNDLYKEQTKLKAKYDLGLVSASQLTTMAESVRELENNYQKAQIGLQIQYNTYLNSLLGYTS